MVSCRERRKVLCMYVHTLHMQIFISHFEWVWIKSKDPKYQKKYSFMITTWHPHENCLNNEKTLRWGMFTFSFWISTWKVVIWHDKKNIVVLNILILDVTKKIAVRCVAVDFTFDFFHMSYTFTSHADCPRFSLLFVSKGKWINQRRELDTNDGRTFENSTKTRMNWKLKHSSK